MLFRGNRVAAAIYTSGTYFPKLIVTFATLIIFALLSGATAKLVLYNRQGAGRLFGSILAAYVVLGFASLVYVTIWIPILTKLPFAAPGVPILGAGQWFQQVGQSFSSLLTEQPLVQSLIIAVLIGYVAAVIPGLRSVARGLIMGSQATLWMFQKLLWYYPLMIGCLAIGIPMKFGLKGMSAYGRDDPLGGHRHGELVHHPGHFREADVEALLEADRFVLRCGVAHGIRHGRILRNSRDESRFGGIRVGPASRNGGSLHRFRHGDEQELRHHFRHARYDIRGPAAQFSHFAAEILTLIPPVLVLGLESPGIPGGAAFFMAPIVAVLLHVRDIDGFVATFVTMYTGLIPMFSTAGNTTNNGLVGAMLTDRFCNYPAPEDPALAKIQNAPASFANQGQSTKPVQIGRLASYGIGRLDDCFASGGVGPRPAKVDAQICVPRRSHAGRIGDDRLAPIADSQSPSSTNPVLLPHDR